MKTCSECGVEVAQPKRGMCAKHYQRWRRATPPDQREDPDYGALPVLARFWSKVNIGTEHECWEWKRPVSSGYGRFYVSREVGSVQAHAFSLSLISQPPDAEHTFALHSCDNRPCVNPGHLRWGDHQMNMDDYRERGQGKGFATACKRGHDLTLEGAVQYKRNDSCKSGLERVCLICRKAHNKKLSEARKAARHARGLLRQRREVQA
jgi:hypothetical protein